MKTPGAITRVITAGRNPGTVVPACTANDGGVVNVTAGITRGVADVHHCRDLTPVGAERAGNAAGTIPEWTGGITRPPENYQPGDHHPDPFKGETPLLRIDQENMHHSAALLSAGHIAMLQRYADYFINVYPTHRSAALPQRVYQKTLENGRTGMLAENGEAVTGVAEGLPFPENAHELIWNHRLRYKGTDGLHVSDMTDMFNGALDRFDWQLTGKREMYVPYNARVHGDDLDYRVLVQAGHLDPQYLRYELHRVWVVEAHPIVFYDVPTLWTTIEIHHDLQSGRFVSYRLNPRQPVPPFNLEMDPSRFTPQALRRMGRR